MQYYMIDVEALFKEILVRWMVVNGRRPKFSSPKTRKFQHVNFDTKASLRSYQTKDRPNDCVVRNVEGAR